MPVYRPSATVRLAVRVDEGRATAELLSRLEPPSPQNAGQLGPGVSASGTLGAELAVTAQQVSTLQKLDTLTGGADPALALELERALARKRGLASAPAGGGSEPLYARGATDDKLSIAIGSIPVLKAEIERSSFRSGDKANLTLNYWDAPFDPRLMRSAGIEIVIAVVSPEEHDAGMHGMTRPDGSRYSTAEDEPGITRTTRFVGFVKKWEMEFGDDGATIRVQADDMMSIIRETPLPPTIEIAHDVPIEQGIGALLDSFPALRGIRVQFGDDTEDGPIPGTAASRRKKLVKKGKKRIRRNAENSNVWDHITDVCVGTGLIPVIDGFVLRLEYARTLYGEKPRVPRMVWGKNLLSLSFARTMHGAKNPTVEVRSYSPDSRRTYAARYPDPKGFGVAIMGTRDFPKNWPGRVDRVTSVTGKNPDQTIRVVPVTDVRPEILPEIARGIFEETARQEIEGSFSTRDPAYFEGDFEQAALLDMKAGDPIALEIDARGQGDAADAVTLLHGMTAGERVEHLVRVGFSRKVAVAYAVLVDQSQLQTIFRVAGVRLGYDHEDGLEITCDFCNFITVRDRPDQHAIKEAGQRKPGAAASKRLSAVSAARRTKDARARAGLGKPATASEREAESAAGDLADELYSDPDDLMSTE